MWHVLTGMHIRNIFTYKHCLECAPRSSLTVQCHRRFVSDFELVWTDSTVLKFLKGSQRGATIERTGVHNPRWHIGWTSTWRQDRFQTSAHRGSATIRRASHYSGPVCGKQRSIRYIKERLLHETKIHVSRARIYRFSSSKVQHLLAPVMNKEMAPVEIFLQDASDF